MEPLAPIVDQMRQLADEELPSPQTCRIYLWDDGTVCVKVYHSREEEIHLLRYQRQTSEIVREYARGNGWKRESLSGGETIHEPAFGQREVRVIATVEPPYDSG